MAWTRERLSTDRLTLRPFSGRDTDAVVTMLTDVDARRYLGGPVDVPVGFSAAALSDQWGAWCVVLSARGTAIGSCTMDRKRGSLELSYTIVPQAWGHGYATEACTAAIEWVWAKTSEPAVVAVTQTANVASMRLLARLGFAEDRRFEEYGAEQSMQSLTRPA